MLRALISNGDVLGGKYRVERVLGEGGMGLVLEARDISASPITARMPRVAVKLMGPSSAGHAAVMKRFDREARTAARLTSPHVARVLDVGFASFGSVGAPFMVMEYLDGCDLLSLLRRDGALEPREALSFMLQACSAVAEAHGLGIVHRDLKPANLFLTAGRDGGPCIKVLDFGVSKLDPEHQHTSSMTTSTSIVGTPLYMAPEQFSNPQEVDARADVWGLGVCLYELLTGRLPFHESNIHRQYALLITKTPERPSEVYAGVPPALDEVVLRCLRKDPADRFASARELRRALEVAMTTAFPATPESAGAESVRDRLQRLSTLRPFVTAPPSSAGGGVTIPAAPSSAPRGLLTRPELFSLAPPSSRRGRAPGIWHQLQRLPGGPLTWAASAALVLAFASMVVLGRGAEGNDSPIVLYAPTADIQGAVKAATKGAARAGTGSAAEGTDTAVSLGVKSAPSAHAAAPPAPEASSREGRPAPKTPRTPVKKRAPQGPPAAKPRSRG